MENAPFFLLSSKCTHSKFGSGCVGNQSGQLRTSMVDETCALTCIENALQQLKQDNNFELESRVGTIKDHRFIPGTSFEYFKKFLDLLVVSTSDWTRVKPTTKLIDYFFPSQIRGRYKVHKIKFVKKEKRLKLSLSTPKRPYAVRISGSYERPVTYKSNNKEPLRCRLQYRCVYVYKNCWKYCLSKTQTGATKDIACKTLPRFEIELEVLPSIFDQYKNHSLRQLATKFLEKTKDLLSRYNENLEEETLPLALLDKWTA